MVLLHDIFHLIKVLFRQFIAVLEDCSYFVVNSIERIKIFLFEVPFFGLIGKKRDLIGYFFIVFH